MNLGVVKLASDKVRRAVARAFRPRLARQARTVGTLSICFDDFPRTAWTEGGRVLRDHGVHGTYYVCGGLCATVWDGEPMFEASDLPAIHAAGHELGCQTFQHVSCLRVDTDTLDRSIHDNEAFVRRQVGDVRLRSFAYPYGDASVTTKRFLLHRFACIRGVDAGLNAGRADLGQLKAVGLELCKRTFDAVRDYVLQAALRRAWVVVYTHDVQDHPSQWGCRPDDLDRLLRLAKSAGLEVLPVSAALAAFTSEGP